MAVTIRNMTAEEFEAFFRWSVEQNVQELMEQLHLSEEEATRETLRELEQMLPDGLRTPHNHLMTVLDAGGESAGFIWMLYEEFEGRKQCFICDFAVWEPKRRKGYAAAALQLAEQHAAKAGCEECVLFVRDDNTPARSLYEKCGYRVLRQKDYGKFMIKKIER